MDDIRQHSHDKTRREVYNGVFHVDSSPSFVRFGEVEFERCIECGVVVQVGMRDIPRWFDDEYKLLLTRTVVVDALGAHLQFERRQKTRMTASKLAIRETLSDSESAAITLHSGTGRKTRNGYQPRPA